MCYNVIKQTNIESMTKTGTHVFLLDEAMNSRCIGPVDEGLCKTIEEMICEQPESARFKI